MPFCVVYTVTLRIRHFTAVPIHQLLLCRRPVFDVLKLLTFLTQPDPVKNVRNSSEKLLQTEKLTAGI